MRPLDPRHAAVSCNVCGALFQALPGAGLIDHADGFHHDPGCFEALDAPVRGATHQLTCALVHPCPETCALRRSVEAHRAHSETHTQAEHDAAAERLAKGYEAAGLPGHAATLRASIPR